MSSYHPLTSGKICRKEVWNENFWIQDTSLTCPLVITQCSLKKLRPSLTLMRQDQIHYTAAAIANILSSFQNITDFSALSFFFVCLFATSTAGKFATNNLHYLKSTNSVQCYKIIQSETREEKKMVVTLQEIFYLYYRGTTQYVKRKIMFLLHIGK